MYKVEETKDSDRICNIMCNELLFNTSMPDEDRELFKRGEWTPNPDNRWRFLAASVDGKDIGIIRFGHFTNISTDIHPHFLPTYWGKHISDTFYPLFCQWIAENTNYWKFIVLAPLSEKAVIAAADRNGFNIEGLLRGAVLWNSKVQDVVVMSKFIGSNK